MTDYEHGTVNPAPRAPGEIGWPADAAEPSDPCLPAAGKAGRGPYHPDEDVFGIPEPPASHVEVEEPAPEPQEGDGEAEE